MTAPELAIEALWSVTDVQKFLGVGRSWIYAQCAAGEMPHLRLSPTLIRFDPAAVKKWALTKSQAKPAMVISIGGRR